MDDETKIILLHETARESWARDLGTFGMIVGLWSFGWFVGSPALEWVGVIMGLAAVVSFAATRLRKKPRMTPSEARAWLDRHFPEPPEAD